MIRACASVKKVRTLTSLPFGCDFLESKLVNLKKFTDVLDSIRDREDNRLNHR